MIAWKITAPSGCRDGIITRSEKPKEEVSLEATPSGDFCAILMVVKYIAINARLEG